MNKRQSVQKSHGEAASGGGAASKRTVSKPTANKGVGKKPLAAEVGQADHFEPHVPGIRYGVLDELVGYAVRRAQIAIYEDFVASLAPWNITPQRFSALTIISLNPRLKLTELADVLGIARSGGVILVDALAEMGYVERHPSPDDKRAYGLALTPKGEKDLADITRAVRAHDARVAQKLSAGEVGELMRTLNRIAGFESEG
jgi:DNA-binding MarR family transcriptional regulator